MPRKGLVGLLAGALLVCGGMAAACAPAPPREAAAPQAPAPELIRSEDGARSAARAPLISYAELQRTDFFLHFVVREVARRADGGLTRISLKQTYDHDSIESIGITVVLDGSSNVVTAELALSRAWVGTPTQIHPMATDIAGTFLLTFTPAVDRPRALLFNDGLVSLHGCREAMTSSDASTEPSSSTPPEVDELLDTFKGKRAAFDEDFRASRLHIRNVAGTDSKALLTLRLDGVMPAQNRSQTAGP